MSVKRTRNFASIFYDIDNYQSFICKLDDTHIAYAVSPLHDSDLKEDGSGEIKKAHYHVVLCFSSVKTREQVSEIFKSLNCVGCEVIDSIRGYMRYLCHLDSPEKAQYSPHLVRFSGLDYAEMCALPADRYSYIGEMMDYIDENKIRSFAELMRVSRTNRPEWFKCLCDSSALIMREYIKSSTWERSL